MPRPRKSTALLAAKLPPSTVALVHSPRRRSMVAAGAQITGEANKPKGSGAQKWQQEAWSFLDTVGELAFAVQWQSNALSRCELFIEHETEEGEVERSESGPAVDILDALYDGPSGQSQMLGAFGTHLNVPGEAWLVGIPSPMGDVWRVLSNLELKREGTKWVIDRGDGRTERYESGDSADTEPEAFVLRIWRPHPAKWVEATSPIRAALPILRELEGLTKHVGASLDSRLSGAGLLLLPSELSFQTPTDDTAPGDERADDFLDLLTETMEAALADQSDPAARVPIVVQAPGAILGNVQHITFATPLSQQAMELRTEAIRRLALSIDLPPEVLLGQSDSNHWSAWLISEDAIKVHIEPLLEVITASLTTEFLWPALRNTSGGPADVERWSIRADTSQLRLRPQRTAEAQQLHKEMVITDAALGRETGFEAGDLLDPTSEEFKRRMLLQIASGVTTADLTAAALAALGVSIAPKPSEVDPSTPTPPSRTPAVDGPPPTPAVEAPRQPPAQAGSAWQTYQPGAPVGEQTAALMVGAELLCLRAMERARNRLGKRTRTMRAADPERIGAALIDAWENVPRVAAMSGVDPGRLQAACEHYVRGRLQTGTEHDPVRLMRYLQGLIEHG